MRRCSILTLAALCIGSAADASTCASVAARQPPGWRDDSPDLEDSPCDIERLAWNETSNSTAFYTDYVKRSRPVILTGLVSSWPAFVRWSRTYAENAVVDLLAGGSRAIATSGAPRDTYNFSALLNGSSKIAFDNKILLNSSLAHDFPSTIPALSPFQDFASYMFLTLTLGASGSGLTFHDHTDSWLGLIAGKKRWFLYTKDEWSALQDGEAPERHAPVGPMHPHIRVAGRTCIARHPHRANGSKICHVTSKVDDGSPVARWAQKELLTARPAPRQCVQLPGELMYVPGGTLHATVNIGETIGVVGIRGIR